jgi:hypothetical protein
MFTIFFNGIGAHTIVILFERQKMNGTYFTKCVLRSLVEFHDPEERKTHEKRVIMHFDTAPIHNMEMIEKHSASFGFERMEKLSSLIILTSLLLLWTDA